MSPRRSRRAALFVLVALSLQVAYAAPSTALAKVQAVLCCAKNCGKSQPIDAASRCCQVQVVTVDPSTAPAAQSIVAPQMDGTVLPALAPSLSVTGPILSFTPQPHGHSRAAPVFLTICKLQL